MALRGIRGTRREEGGGKRQGEIEEELPGHRGTGAARGSLKGILRTPICLRSAPIPAHHIHHVRPRRTHTTTGIPTSCQATSHITAAARVSPRGVALLRALHALLPLYPTGLIMPFRALWMGRVAMVAPSDVLSSHSVTSVPVKFIR